MDSLKHTLGNMVRGAYSSFVPPPTASRFFEEGILTPQEFVAAGDQLVGASPSWSWKPAANEKLRNQHLPNEKQYLTTQAQCNKRIKEDTSVQKEMDMEDDWSMMVETNSSNPNEKIQNKESLGKIIKTDYFNNETKNPESSEKNEETKEDHGFVSIQEPEEDSTRIYDLVITYDLYYFTPRMWLSGYYKEVPLKSEEIWEDIMPEYVKKTVTFENNPQLGIDQMSIHPCKHANIMKNLIETIRENEGKIEVHQALFIFLKFMASIIPTIEYDFTFGSD